MKFSIPAQKAFEQNCCQLIIEAFKVSLFEKIIQSDWNENDISYELYEKMEINPKRIKYQIHLSPEFRIPKNVSKTKGFSDKLPRIDLKMANFVSEKEFKYFFEAKRLKEKSSSLKRAYIKEGMDRFISEKYPLGCMLGYLLEGELDKTIKGINSLLKKDKRNTEILNLKSEESLKSIYKSNHSDAISLKHLFFDFTETIK
ncbi:hypothetical protein [Algoriella sp.]|uniref:hypothetical protein n=1 Tax=Algoriella sp. TaxID=1872434 RepID=UPI002FC6A4C2